MQTFKKLDDNKFKRIDVNESITILDKDALENQKEAKIIIFGKEENLLSHIQVIG